MSRKDTVGCCHRDDDDGGDGDERDSNEAEERGDGERGDDGRDDSHLDDLSDGAGCTEIWEHLSERRDRDDDTEHTEE